MDNGPQFDDRNGDSRLDKAQREDLYNWILAYRIKFKNYWNAFSDEQCKMYALNPPSTLPQFQQMEGVGEIMGDKYGPEFLATIWSFMSKRGLLPKFPDLARPTEEKMPVNAMWSDPTSGEAEALRDEEKQV